MHNVDHNIVTHRKKWREIFSAIPKKRCDICRVTHDKDALSLGFGLVEMHNVDQNIVTPHEFCSRNGAKSIQSQIIKCLCPLVARWDAQRSSQQYRDSPFKKWREINRVTHDDITLSLGVGMVEMYNVDHNFLWLIVNHVQEMARNL